jgi:dynein light chain roadblock-type
MLPGDVTDVT